MKEVKNNLQSKVKLARFLLDLPAGIQEGTIINNNITAIRLIYPQFM